MVYKPLILKNIQNYNEELYYGEKSPDKQDAGGPLCNL